MLRKLTETDVDFELIVHEEDLPINGNAIASGNDEYDNEVEKELSERLNSGDAWAWCCVEVKATFGHFSASDFLGGCSYKDENEFTQPGGYYDDMKEVALEALNSELQYTYNELKALRS